MPRSHNLVLAELCEAPRQEIALALSVAEFLLQGFVTKTASFLRDIPEPFRKSLGKNLKGDFAMLNPPKNL